MGYQCGPIGAVSSVKNLKEHSYDDINRFVDNMYVNGNGRDAPNYDYYLNPDPNQLRYSALMSPDQLQEEFGVSRREAIAMYNSLQHKPHDKQSQFLEVFRDFKEQGITNPSFEQVKAKLVELGYNPNDPYQNTEITAWANWFAPGDLYDNLL